MLRISFLVLVLLVLSSGRQPVDNFKPVAVVELFTSEGCSSCPPADKLLAKTLSETEGSNPNVFGLAFHVDYWNRLGWKDTFSTAQFSERQGMYASAMHLNGVYTPQMVVNGATEFVGSDKSSLDEAILKSLNTKAEAGFSNLRTTQNNGNLTVDYELKGDIKNCQIHFALISLHVSTSVKNGENRGHLLEHTNVVRQFISYPAAVSGHVVFSNCSNYNAANTAVIAFVQQQNGLRIITAAMVKTNS